MCLISSKNIIRPICKPLSERLKKNLKPWTEEHTETVQKNQIPCQINSVFISDKPEGGFNSGDRLIRYEIWRNPEAVS